MVRVLLCVIECRFRGKEIFATERGDASFRCCAVDFGHVRRDGFTELCQLQEESEVHWIGYFREGSELWLVGERKRKSTFNKGGGEDESEFERALT